MLREVLLDDEQREADCERCMVRLLSAVKAIARFREGDVIDHFEGLEIARDRLSEILDKAEGK